jgi:hypothetical protein
MPSSPPSAAAALAAAVRPGGWRSRRGASGLRDPVRPRVEVGGVDFLDLIAEQFDFLFGGVFGVAEFVEFGGLGAPRAVALAVAGVGGLGAGVGVEHGELAFGGEQRLVVVRAVEVDEVFAEALEQG